MNFVSTPVRAAVLGLLAPVSLCVSMSAAAQTATLKETVVTASRVEQPLADVVADVSIIERADIERLGVGTVTEILSRVPGIQIVDRADTSRVFIRGADSRMTALYIDGVRVDTQDGAVRLGGGAPWELVPLSQIERIEVLRGPASAVYGSNAMGGVVQIFTRNADVGFRPFASVGAGSNNTRKLASGFNGSGEGWDYGLGVGIEDSDGINTRPDLVHTPSTEAYTRRNANLQLGRQITDSQRVELNVLDSQFDSRYVPYGGGISYQAKAHMNTAGLKWRARWSDIYSTDLSFSRARIGYRDDAPNNYVTTLQGVLLENKILLAGGTLVAALEEKVDAFASQEDAYNPAFSGQRTQNGLALGYGKQRGLHAIQINARQDRDNLFGDFQTGAISYGYSLDSNWKATLSSGTAFRAPTLEQLFSQYGNTQLQPETNRSHEVGVQYTQVADSFKAVVYRNEISNMITSAQSFTACAAGSFCYFNVGRAVIQGATLSGSTLWGAYTLRGAFDLLNPRDDITGRDLNLRARQSMMLAVDRSVAQWRIGGEFRAVGERFDDAANSQRLPGYSLLNLVTTRALSQDWRLVARLDNLADTKYQQVLNYATPGRTFFIGLNWQPSR